MGRSDKEKGLVDSKKRKDLAEDIIDSRYVTGKKNRQKRKRTATEDDTEVGDRLARRILQRARHQREETSDNDDIVENEEDRTVAGSEKAFSRKPLVSLAKKSGLVVSSGEESDEEYVKEEFENYAVSQPEQLPTEEEEKAYQLFMSSGNQHASVAELLKEKLTEKRTEIMTLTSESQVRGLDPKIAEMYRTVGQLLSRYRSGKLPKAFKIIPALGNWVQVLSLTEPDNWTAAAVLQATRLFCSSHGARSGQKFVNLVLLPRVRDDIAEFKKLNYHLYIALEKSLFRPAVFFKGFLLPLCESGTCTLQEAVIISSVLTKVSISVLHASAAMLKIAQMTYSGANSIFLRALINKGYSLPLRVVDSLAQHFLGFLKEERQLPVLWHQCLLDFVQRYKDDLSREQIEPLTNLCRVHSHHQITPLVIDHLAKAAIRGGQSRMDTI